MEIMSLPENTGLKQSLISRFKDEDKIVYYGPVPRESLVKVNSIIYKTNSSLTEEEKISFPDKVTLAEDLYMRSNVKVNMASINSVYIDTIVNSIFLPTTIAYLLCSFIVFFQKRKVLYYIAISIFVNIYLCCYQKVFLIHSAGYIVLKKYSEIRDIFYEALFWTVFLQGLIIFTTFLVLKYAKKKKSRLF
ncbi:hypothetical protein [Victivallis sp. Marseille-Q1083]|uniref:hypothetical protein n=1 Tax=Victivallis sp. Marseille-Q1083 TaxID=2717288 RepID=UPI00158D6DC0|nr:hypothetical protein [Victivallis sp. Marseille-Q1083]